MSGPVPNEESMPSAEIAELRDRVRALEIRLDRIERLGPEVVVHAEAGIVAAPAIDTEVAAATIFRRVAMLCFVLLGALILRVLTQQNVFAATFGTILGFLYAGHLIVLSMIPGRFGGIARENSVFQCSGAILAYVIAIEAALRSQTMSRSMAMIIIAGYGLLALGMGIHHRKAALAATGILGAIMALVALDMKEGTLNLQLGLVTLLAAGGIANSWREGWHWLRPLTTVLMVVLVPAGFFFCGKEPGAARGLLATASAFWIAVMIQHLLVFSRLDRGAAWLPVLTAWLIGIQQLAHWSPTAVTTGVMAAFLLGCVIVYSRHSTGNAEGLAGLMATAALAGAVGWSLLDRTGLLCAIGGLALWFAGRRAAPDWAAAFATLLMVTSAAMGLAQLLTPPVAVSGLIAMAVSAGIMVFHYSRNGRTGTGPYTGLAMRLAPVALAAGLVLLLGLFWELLNRAFREPAQLLLCQTVVIVMTALLLTFWGHVGHRRTPLFCGLACMALGLVKVVLLDLVRLRSFYMLTSLVLVGLASIAISVILRRRS